jgi:hypothetical protein
MQSRYNNVRCLAGAANIMRNCVCVQSVRHASHRKRKHTRYVVFIPTCHSVHRRHSSEFMVVTCALWTSNYTVHVLGSL